MLLFFHSNRTKRCFLLSLSILCIIAIVYERDVCNRKECPFHHLQSNLAKPFYKLNCPDSAKWSKVNRDHDENTSCSNLPSIVMLNARPLEARLNSSQSWEGHDMFLINTTNLGRSNLTCAVSSFANILFTCITLWGKYFAGVIFLGLSKCIPYLPSGNKCGKASMSNEGSLSHSSGIFPSPSAASLRPPDSSPSCPGRRPLSPWPAPCQTVAVSWPGRGNI